MDKDFALLLTGAGIALVSGIIAALIQHYLSLRADRVKRERDREDDVIRRERDKQEREARKRRRALSIGEGVLVRPTPEDEIKEALERAVKPRLTHLLEYDEIDQLDSLTGDRPRREVSPDAPKDVIKASERQDGHVLIDVAPRENLPPEPAPEPRKLPEPPKEEVLPPSLVQDDDDQDEER